MLVRFGFLEGMETIPLDPHARAICELARRRARYDFLPSVEFTDYSWDLILYLFVMNGADVTVGEACQQARAPRTTMLRHIETMEASGTISRKTDRLDRRRSYLRLTDQATKQVEAYLCSDYPSMA